jgi:DNA polymerase delta subunit 1
MWMEMDVADGEPLAVNPAAGRTVPGARAGVVPVLRMYGVTADGNSVAAHIHGFTAYFFVSPPPGMTEADIPGFTAALEAQLGAGKAKARVPQAVLGCALEPDRQSLMGYHGGRRQSMLRIYVAAPQLVSTAKGVLERGMGWGRFPPKSYLCFEAAVPFPLRFMIDKDIQGCSWCEFPAGTYAVRPPAKRVTHCQLELDVVYECVVAHEPTGQWQRIPPLRILSFDIECMGRKGCFPEAEHDPVIQIANVVTLQGSSTSIIRNVLTLGHTSPIVGAQVLCHEREEDMLAAWAEFVRQADPDVITGYNVQNFDLPYLLNRCRKLKVDSGQLLGRVRGVKATMRDTTFSSSAYGKHENVETTIDGRVIFDMLQYTRREHKLSSYSLNSVSAHFLGQQKEDVHHSIIGDLQRGSPDDRRRLATYCL